MVKKRKEDTIRAARIKKTAKVLGVSERYVNMVLDGTRSSDVVMTVYMEMTEGENKLLQEVEKLVPFLTKQIA